MRPIFARLKSLSSANELVDNAMAVRRTILQMHHISKTSHIGSSFSVVDILLMLFLEKAARSQSDEQLEIVLSKGHAASALYAVLKHIGCLSESDIANYCADFSNLYGHVSHHAHPWIPLSTGSLGHGLPFTIGMALGSKIANISTLHVVIISDGELNEGTTWESALLAKSLHLENLVCFVDANGIQSLGRTEEILSLEPIVAKWQSFGWHVIEANGHDFEELLSINLEANKPNIVLLRSIKGKGISFMEDKLEWHYRSPNEEDVVQALLEFESRSFHMRGKG